MTTFNIAARNLFTATLLRPKAGDALVLDDASLKYALSGRQRLKRGQWEALVRSPLTLRRLQYLAAQRKLMLQQAANDVGWSTSRGLLLAADDGEALASLRTEDSHWTLHFLQGPAGWQVVLTLAGSAPFARSLQERQLSVTVLDAAQQVLLYGVLDADGELEAPWPVAASPAEHFRATGGRFSVQLSD